MGRAIRRRFCINADCWAVDKPGNIGNDARRKIYWSRIFGEYLVGTRRISISGDGRIRNPLSPVFVQSIIFSKSPEATEEDG